MGGPLGKVSTAQSHDWATSDATLRDQKRECIPPVRPHSGATRWTDPGEVKEMKDEEKCQGEEKKRAGVVKELQTEGEKTGV